jgi:Transposase IS4
MSLVCLRPYIRLIFLRRYSHIRNKKVIIAAVLYGELLRWFGLWFLMATTNGWHQCEFWSSMDIHPICGAPFCFGGFMSRQKLDNIQTLLLLTNDNPPAYKDCFWAVRGLIAEWNKNMTETFWPGWVA